VGVLNTSLDERVVVEAHSCDLLTGEILGQSPESVRILIDDGHRVTNLCKVEGKGGTNSAAAHDDKVHDKTLPHHQLLRHAYVMSCVL